MHSYKVTKTKYSYRLRKTNLPAKQPNKSLPHLLVTRFNIWIYKQCLNSNPRLTLLLDQQYDNCSQTGY